MINNQAATITIMAAIGFAVLLVGIRCLLDLRDFPHFDPNVGDE